jgi:SAM-dependent methyltransferase
VKQGQLTAYDVIERYDDAYYDDLASRYRRRNRFARQRIRNVFALLPPLEGRRLLDLGCGMGTFTFEAARAGSFAVGLDSMAPALRAARRVAVAEGVSTARFVRGDAARLPFADAGMDIVVAADLTEHLDDVTLARVLAEARRVLREGGTIVLYTPDRNHVFERLRDAGILKQDSSHIGVRDDRELARVLEGCGFVDVRVRHLPSHLPGWNVLERGLARWVPLLRRRVGITARRDSR